MLYPSHHCPETAGETSWMIIRRLIHLKLAILKFSFNRILSYLNDCPLKTIFWATLSELLSLRVCCRLHGCGQEDKPRWNHVVLFLGCTGESRRQGWQYRALRVVRFSSMLPTVSRAAAQAESIHMVLRKSHNQSICWQAGLSHVPLMNNLQRLWEGKLRSTPRLAWPFPPHLSLRLCLRVDSTDSWQVWIWERC